MTALSVQLSELEMLQSMFSPAELRIESSLINDMRAALSSDHADHASPPLVSFALNLDLEMKISISVTLPCDYPAVEPEIFVRSEFLDRQQQDTVNRELQNFVSNLERGDVCIYSAISWLQENAQKFKQNISTSVAEKKNLNDRLVRLWIYSHHIYNKNKRKNISAYATQHSCTGFTLPGRPGIICIEGYEEDCDEVWRKIRSMNWKKIMLKKKEDCVERSFSSFEETSFNKCKDERHMDMGQFLKYLDNHNCGYIFKEYFGVDGKLPADEI